MAPKKEQEELGLLVLAGLGVWAFGKKVPPPGENAASCTIQILDAATGSPVPKNSPALVVEGSSYIARIIVANRSTKTGSPVGATLTVDVKGYAGSITIPFAAPVTEAYLAQETKTKDWTFTMPAGTAGIAGSIVVAVKDPTGAVVSGGTCTEPLTISSAAIEYAASCSISVL